MYAPPRPSLQDATIDQSADPASGALAAPSPRARHRQLLAASARRPRFRELFGGVRAALPLAMSLVPFLLVFGVVARAAGLTLLETFALAICVFSGVQLVAVQMLLAGAPGLLIFAAGAIMNARHLLYSAQLSPYLRRLSLPWRLLLAALLTDEVWAVSLHRYRAGHQPTYQHWWGLGAGLSVWLAAQGATLVGALLGSQVPAGWHLELAAPFTFLSLLVLSRPGRAGICAALAAALVAWLAASLPLGLGLLVATGLGVVVGLAVERLSEARREVHR